MWRTKRSPGVEMANVVRVLRFWPEFSGRAVPGLTGEMMRGPGRYPRTGAQPGGRCGQYHQ
jgi:hypothetical protein